MENSLLSILRMRTILDSLVEEILSLTGKVGVCLDGVLGSVCDVNWDVNDASVFCNGIGENLVSL